MKPGAITYATGPFCSPRKTTFARRTASAFFVGLLFFAVLSAYVGPFALHDGAAPSGIFAVMGEDDASGRSGSHGHPGADELGDGVDLFPGAFGGWSVTPRFEREPVSARFEFRGDPLTPQSLERPPPGR